MPKKMKVDSRKLNFNLILFFFLAVVSGCRENVSSKLFNSKINTNSVTEVYVHDLTNFEWSAVCVIPQYIGLNELINKYPFFKNSEDNSFKLSPKDERYIEQKRPLLLFFDDKLNKYTPIIISDETVRNGMEWYLETESSKIRQTNYLKELPDSELIKNECLQYSDSPTIRFVTIASNSINVNKVFKYLILSKGERNG